MVLHIILIVHVESKINFQKCLKSVLHIERCNDVHYAAAAQSKDIRPSNIDFSFPLPLAETNDSRSRGTSRLYFLASCNRPYRLSPRLSPVVSCTRRPRFTFASGTNTMSRHVRHWISFQVLEWRVCVRTRKVGNSHDIRSFFHRMTDPHCLLDTISTVSLLFIRLKERRRRDANAKRKVWISLSEYIPYRYSDRRINKPSFPIGATKWGSDIF